MKICIFLYFPNKKEVINKKPLKFQVKISYHEIYVISSPEKYFAIKTNRFQQNVKHKNLKNPFESVILNCFDYFSAKEWSYGLVGLADMRLILL